MTPEPMLMRSFRVPGDLWDATTELAERERCTVSDVVRRALAAVVEADAA